MTVSSRQFIYHDRKLLATVACFKNNELVSINYLAVWAAQQIHTIQLSFAKTSQEEIKCTKARKQLRTYCVLDPI